MKKELLYRIRQLKHSVNETIEMIQELMNEDEYLELSIIYNHLFLMELSLNPKNKEAAEKRFEELEKAYLDYLMKHVFN